VVYNGFLSQFSGEKSWPNNLKLKFITGTNFCHGEVASLPPLGPNEVTDISITMIAPFSDGCYEGQWRMITLAGTLCGGNFMILYFLYRVYKEVLDYCNTYLDLFNYKNSTKNKKILLSRCYFIKY